MKTDIETAVFTLATEIETFSSVAASTPGEWSSSVSTPFSNRTRDVPSVGLDWPYTMLTTVMSSLSIFGGLGIALIYIFYKDLRTPGRLLLVYLSLMDALTAFGNILGVIWLIHRDSDVINKSMAYCKIQSAMTIYSSISSFSWTIVMGLCLVFSIVKSSPSFAAKYMKLFHIVSWLLPAAVTIIALSTNVLGYDTTLDQPSWCWIDPRVPNALFWQFFTGKFWEISTYIATVVLYSVVKFFLWKKSKTTMVKAGRSRKAALQEANMKLTFVPLVFIVFRIWGTLRFLLGFFAHDFASSNDSRWIAILQGIGDSAQGIANFVLYICMTEKIRQRLLATICCREYKGDTQPLTSLSKVGTAKDTLETNHQSSNSRIGNAKETVGSFETQSQSPYSKQDTMKVTFTTSEAQYQRSNLMIGTSAEKKFQIPETKTYPQQRGVEITKEILEIQQTSVSTEEMVTSKMLNV